MGERPVNNRPEDFRIWYKCSCCYDRGYIFYYGQGTGRALGQCYKEKCRFCGGNWAYEGANLDAVYKKAMTWFRSSQPPGKPFRLFVWKTVDDPVKYWQNMREEIASDNVYVLERIRDDIVRLHELFGNEDDF